MPGNNNNFDQSRKRRWCRVHRTSDFNFGLEEIQNHPQTLRLTKTIKSAITRFIEQSSSSQHPQEETDLGPGGSQWIQSLFEFLKREDDRVKIEDVNRWVKGQPWIVREALASSTGRPISSRLVNGSGAGAPATTTPPQSTSDHQKLEKCQKMSQTVLALRELLQDNEMREFGVHVDCLNPIINTLSRIQKSILMGKSRQQLRQNIHQETVTSPVAATSSSGPTSTPTTRNDGLINAKVEHQNHGRDHNDADWDITALLPNIL